MSSGRAGCAAVWEQDGPGDQAPPVPGLETLRLLSCAAVWEQDCPGDQTPPVPGLETLRPPGCAVVWEQDSPGDQAPPGPGLTRTPAECGAKLTGWRGADKLNSDRACHRRLNWQHCTGNLPRDVPVTKASKTGRAAVQRQGNRMQEC